MRQQVVQIVLQNDLPMQSNMFSNFLTVTRKPSLLFLIDGVGALLSAILLVAMVLPLQGWFGMPPYIVRYLAIPAFALAGYSLICYLIKPSNHRPYLVFIAVANIIYCIITSIMLLRYSGSITPLGIAYFLGEISIVITIASLELLAAKTSNKTGSNGTAY